MSQTLHRTKLRAPGRGTAARYLRSVSARIPNTAIRRSGIVPGADADVRALERLVPSENGLTVFDADTQETSYGICFFDGLPYIFDTHRKGTQYVATIELLTEVVQPVRVARDSVDRFRRNVRAAGLLPIPYTGCFFKGNLHIYAFSGPVRGFDLAAIGNTADRSEVTLFKIMDRLKSRIPGPIGRAQRELLEGKRHARHTSDLRVLAARWKETGTQALANRGKRRSL